jgi:5-methylcytosine-specific restriction endonuclease McrA
MPKVPVTYRNTAQQSKDRARIRASRPACHICGEPIDYDLQWPHPRCFVVDHIIPLKRGGADNLTNKAAAHAECNSKKRARLVAPIVRRSGSLG